MPTGDTLAPTLATASVAPLPVTAPSVSAAAAASVEPPAVAPRPVRATPQVTLAPEQLTNLRQRFPRSRVQSAVTAPARHGTATLALIWEDEPAPEGRCPPEATWSAYDIQSCTGFKDSLAGMADLVRFDGAELAEVFPLEPFFDHDANPSGVEIDGRRGPHRSFFPADYRIALYDLNGDGRASELVFHNSNGPYAIIEHYVAVGLFRAKLETPKTRKGGFVAVGLDAWESLERTGRGSSELYCGARCANTAIRWVVERNARGLVSEREFWTCTPEVATSWKRGERTRPCD